ncbi:DUF3541 domain-containing protein [Halomonas cupida]|uniref:DUF3541 domain-containing protein n=1 Tax=Halomonas TaxID=2745 RepID=UPI001C98F065|nr:DUF3541 domain-containing protein [Halomonas sp. DP5Y7-2]MBY5983985.1 DUF3541 domain-containing protein [Halomonas sp. DP5Y7-2]
MGQWQRCRRLQRRLLYVVLVGLSWAAPASAYDVGDVSTRVAEDSPASHAPADALAPVHEAGVLEARSRQAAIEIRASYDGALESLPNDKQRHYAQRLWRLTGDPAYLCWNRQYAQRLLQQLARDAATVEDPAALRARNRQLLEGYPETRAKQRRRKAMLADYPQMMLPMGILFRLTQAQYHGLLERLPPGQYASLTRALDEVDWHAFLTDPEVISVYAAQVANQATFLAELGIVDLRDDVASAFRSLYPAERIAELSSADYHNWLYGLTHFVIAASRYYQRTAQHRSVDWAVEALVSQSSALAQVKTDIVAEVALSLQLGGRADHPLVDTLHAILLERRDPSTGILPGTDGSLDLASGEHRNVLAIMTLGWTGSLYPGPFLTLEEGDAAVACGAGELGLCETGSREAVEGSVP